MKPLDDILEGMDMARFQQQRGNVLTAEERAKSARKCLDLLSSPRVPRPQWPEKDQRFYHREYGYAQSMLYAPSDQTMQWLRDLVSRYVT